MAKEISISEVSRLWSDILDIVQVFKNKVVARDTEVVSLEDELNMQKVLQSGRDGGWSILFTQQSGGIFCEKEEGALPHSKVVVSAVVLKKTPQKLQVRVFMVSSWFRKETRLSIIHTGNEDHKKTGWASHLRIQGCVHKYWYRRLCGIVVGAVSMVPLDMYTETSWLLIRVGVRGTRLYRCVEREASKVCSQKNS